MREARIGSVPWLAGLWWLGVGVAAHQTALGLVRVGARAGLILAVADFAAWALDLADRCAKEAGAED